MILGRRRQAKRPPKAQVFGVWHFLSLVLGIGLVVALVANRVTASRYQESTQAMAAAGARLQQSRERIDALHTKLDGLFGEIVVNLERQFIPLDRSTRIALRAGQGICQQIANETTDPVRRASAYCTLGHISFHRDDLQAAVDAYQQAAKSATFDSVEETMLVKAYAANHLVGVLYQLGHEGDSLRVSQQVVEQLNSHIDASEVASFEAVDELAFATRNLAVLQASRGELCQAIEVARSHLDILGQLHASRPNDVDLAERVIDAKFLLAGLLWRDTSPARNSIRAASLDLIEEAVQSVNGLTVDAERRMRSGESVVDYGRYKSEAERATRELLLARQSSDQASTEPLRTPSFWTRKNLYRGRRSISTEILLDDLRMPAEFERQEAMIVKWSGRAWQDVGKLSLIRELASQLLIMLLVDDFDTEGEVRDALTHSGVGLENIRFFQVPSNSMWVRDFGPLTVVGPDDFPIWIDYQHPSPESRTNNDLLVDRLGRLTGHRVIRGPLLLEGGNLIGNGTGLMVCTRQLERDNEKLGYSAEQFRKQLGSMFGCRQLVVLDNLKREATGHVDWFVTFVSQDTVVVGEYDAATDPENSEILNTNAHRLAQIRVGGAGERLKVIRIPMPPHPSTGFGGSYTNVVFANGKLLIPQYDNASEDMNSRAVNIYQTLLPDWQMIPFDCSKMLSDSGAIHCATSNVPSMPVNLRASSNVSP